MKKILLLILFCISSITYGQKLGADVIKFSGSVTTTVRDTFFVPSGEVWFIYNTTADRLELGRSSGTTPANWSALVDGFVTLSGTNTIPEDINWSMAEENNTFQQRIEMDNNSNIINIVAGSPANSTRLAIEPTGMFAVGFSNAEIDAGGSNAIITKGYADANYGGGGITWSTPVDSNILPDTNQTYDIGAVGNVFQNMYANAFNGSLFGSNVEVQTVNTTLYNQLYGQASDLDPTGFAVDRVQMFYNGTDDRLRLGIGGTSTVETIAYLSDVGGGGGIGGTIADNQIPVGTGANTIGPSIMTDDGTTVIVDGKTIAEELRIGVLDQAGLGPELVTNGNFDTDSDWDKPVGVTISGGEAIFTNVATNLGINQTIVGITGKTVTTSYTISSFTDGLHELRFPTDEGDQTGTGTFTYTGVAEDDRVFIRAKGGVVPSNFRISNVSVKEVLGGSLLPVDGLDMNEHDIANVGQVLGDLDITGQYLVNGVPISGGGITWATPVDASIVPDANLTYEIGSNTNRFVNLWVSNIISDSQLYTPTDTEPNPNPGRIYFDDSEGTIKQYNGTAWEALGGKISQAISGRTGTPITAFMEQTQAQYDADGAAPAGTYVAISDADPASSFTGTAVPLDGYYQIDDTGTDTATWTLGTSKNGGSAEININLASEPSVTGATQVTGTTAFASNTLMVLTIKNFSGTVKYWFTEL